MVQVLGKHNMIIKYLDPEDTSVLHKELFGFRLSLRRLHMPPGRIAGPSGLTPRKLSDCGQRLKAEVPRIPEE